MKGKDLRIYDDATLLKQYQISDKKGKMLGIPKARARMTQQQTPRYGRDKGKAPQKTHHRNSEPGSLPSPLSEYERYAAGGA